MEPSIEDIQHLEAIDKKLDEWVGKLSNAIKQETELEIVLIGELKGMGIAQSLSLKSKFVELRNKSDNPQVDQWVDDWIMACSETRKLEIQIDQLKGRRDSIKKKLSVYNERGI